VVAKRSSPLPPLHCPVVREPELPVLPLCGITAALRHAQGRAVVILACDMPFVTPQLLAWLAALEGAAIAQARGRPQPLMGRYLHAQLPALERALHRALPVTAAVLALGPRLLDEGELSRFGDPRTLCFNVNDRRELAEAERRVVAHAG
jgi:molybdopterin-guanine dinucleotide biosynthesis protein A